MIEKPAKIVNLNIQTSNLLSILTIIVVFIVSVSLVYNYLPVDVAWEKGGPFQIGVDWKGPLRGAAIELINGRSPYNIHGFFNPWWVLIPLFPLLLISPELGSAILFVLNIFCFMFVMMKLGSNVWKMIIFIIFSGVLLNSINGNIEGILALGFLFPPVVGMLFILGKPQIGIAVVVYWMIESWRENGFVGVIKLTFPVSVFFGLSFIFYGNWISSLFILPNAWWNASIFPKGIPIGLILLGFAIWKREIRLAISASPFFAPYFVGYTWAFLFMGLLTINFRDFFSQFKLSRVRLPRLFEKD